MQDNKYTERDFDSLLSQDFDSEYGNKKSRKRNFLFLLLVPLVGLFAVGYLVVRKVSLSSVSGFVQTQNVPPPPKPSRVSVAALGYLKPESEIISVSAPAGERIGSLNVKEGDFVKQADVIAYLDSYNQQRAQVEYAAAQLKEIQEQLQTDTLLQKLEIDKARTQRQQVDIPVLLQVQSQQSAVNRLQAEAKNAEEMYKRYNYLQAQGAVPRQQFDDKKVAWDAARENFNQARLNLQQIQKSRNLEIETANSDVTQAEVNKERVLTDSQLQSKSAALQLAQAQLARTVIRAPISGRILKVFARSGEAISENGIVQMADTSQMNAVAEVYETDIGLVKLGQRATVTSPAFAKPMSGAVIHIGQLVFKNRIVGDNPAADADARVIEVKVRLDNSAQVANLSNLRVDVNIQLARARHAHEI